MSDDILKRYHLKIWKILKRRCLLGTGGGGDPYIGKLMAEQAIQKNGPVPAQM